MYYTLRIMRDLKDLHAVARDQAHALHTLGDELKATLTLEDQGHVAEYMMDEWSEDEGAHWTNPTIPVWRVR
jgi:hypothetical protein